LETLAAPASWRALPSDLPLRDSFAMGKRSGLLKRGSRPHGPGDSGGYNKKPAGVKKKKKIKLKKPKAATTTAAAAAAAAPTSSDDLFSMALPVRGKERAAPAQVEEVDMVEKPAAFELAASVAEPEGSTQSPAACTAKLMAAGLLAGLAETIRRTRCSATSSAWPPRAALPR